MESCLHVFKTYNDIVMIVAGFTAQGIMER